MPEDIFWKKYAERFRTYPTLIPEEINPYIKAIICIPVCAEPNLLSTLESIMDCHHPDISIEVILLFNRNEWMTVDELVLHDQSWLACEQWISERRDKWIKFRPLNVKSMPDGKGGVGWARKLAMDEASCRLDKNGIIICLDADCTVAHTYIEEILIQFDQHKLFEATSIYFEHGLAGLPPDQREAIISYELHLRYLVNAQKWCGHPFSYQTVGSSMAVRRNAYLLQGGMNTKQAGEDFYFLQKFIENGKLFEIKNTTVYPSARVSSRVPFGTGKAMHQMNEGNRWMTTDFETFRRIKPLFESVRQLMDICKEEFNYEVMQMRMPQIGEEVMEYLKHINFVETLITISRHTNSLSSFQKRFFRYFNAFMMIRYMHYMRDRHFPDVPVLEAAGEFCKASNIGMSPAPDIEKCLLEFRKLDRSR